MIGWNTVLTIEGTMPRLVAAHPLAGGGRGAGGGGAGGGEGPGAGGARSEISWIMSPSVLISQMRPLGPVLILVTLLA